jgi:hypothetical protein
MNAVRVAAVAVALTTVSTWAAERDMRVRTTEPREPGEDSDLELKLQGGVVTYTGEAAALTSPGAAYGVLVATDLFGAVDGELSYQGAAYGTDSSLGSRNSILENGGQALVMLSPTVGRFEPYAFTGLAVSFLSVMNGGNPGSLVEDATLFKLPIGAGIDWVPAGDGGGEVDFLIGARVKYDLTLDSGAFPTLDNRMSSNQLQTTLQVGATF